MKVLHTISYMTLLFSLAINALLFTGGQIVLPDFSRDARISQAKTELAQDIFEPIDHPRKR